MKQQQNIETLFKDAFEGYEEQVNPDLWNAVQSQIAAPAGNVAGTAGSAGQAGTVITGKVASLIAGALITGSVITAVIYNSLDNKQITDQQLTEQVVVPADQNLDQPSNKVTGPAETTENGVAAVTSSNADHFKLSDAAEIQNPTGPEKSTQPKNTQVSGSGESTEVQPPVNNKSVVNPNAASTTSDVTSQSTSHKVAGNQGSEKIPHSIPPAQFDRYTPIIIAAPGSGYAPLKVDLSFQGDGSDINWQLDNQELNQHSRGFSHTFETPGNYEITLTTKDFDGVVHTTKTTIVVKQGSGVETIPNVFTPNGDGLNDRFQVVGNNLKDVEAAVFNKSGRQIYRWNSTDGGWDGKYLSGETAEEGTYFYVIFVRGADDRDYQFKGTITLIR